MNCILTTVLAVWTIYALLAAALVLLGLVAAVASMMSKDDGKGITTGPSCDTCDGTDSKCEQVCMMEAAVKPIEYFEDEELDSFAGRSSDSYSDEEVELFEEVLTTLQPQEVAAWSRSLTLRGISVPDQLKDELLMLREG